MTRRVKLLFVDYDAGTKIPGSGFASEAWRDVVADLPSSVSKVIDGRTTMFRSLGRYIPSLVRLAVGQCLRDGTVPIVLGGDHSITYSTAWAARESTGPVDVVHADAHHDSYPVPYLSNYSFARHAERDFGHTWHGVGWRHEEEYRRPLRLEQDVTGPAWLTLDFDYFDVSVFPEVAFPAPQPGGTEADLAATLSRMKGPILGADLLEWVPGGAAECRAIASRTLEAVVSAL